MLNAEPLFSGEKYRTGIISVIAGTAAAPADCKHLPRSAIQKVWETSPIREPVAKQQSERQYALQLESVRQFPISPGSKNIDKRIGG